jgi:protein CpxP
MNLFKVMLRLTGAIAAIAIATSPIAAFAQAPSQRPSQQQSQQSEAPITLSQKQQAQFKAIQEKTLADIQGVLNEEQKAQFAAGMQSGEGFRAVKNLSDTQKTQIVAILQKFDAQIDNLLTPDQKAKIREFQQRNQQRQQNQK